MHLKMKKMRLRMLMETKKSLIFYEMVALQKNLPRLQP